MIKVIKFVHFVATKRFQDARICLQIVHKITNMAAVSWMWARYKSTYLPKRRRGIQKLLVKTNNTIKKTYKTKS